MLYANGSVIVNWYDHGDRRWYNGYRVEGVRNVTSLAIHSDMRAYTIQDGKIQEYQLDISKPYQWKSIGEVTTAVGK